ncbi:MAG: S-layer homology domain-containing protein [Butyricicoccus porcorum]|nr:S-layer homology domain-containing protein [Butyricicoccus porcorum]
MKKKLTAFLLTAAMLCSLMPMAAATSGPDDDTAAGGSDITALLNEVSGEGYTFTTRDQLPEGTEIIEPEITIGTGNKMSEPTQEIEPTERIKTYSAELPEQTERAEKAEYTTTKFSSYGAQLSNLVVQTSSKTYAVGKAMKKLYDAYRADVRKGANSQCLKDNSDSNMKRFAVTINLSGINSSNYEDLMGDMEWLTYLSLDYDTPEMFYSNGYMGISGTYSKTSVTIYFRPMYSAGFTTKSDRTTLNTQMENKVKELVNAAADYPRAYDKMMFFHDWLCENNSYNHDAVSSNNYVTSVSGAPWSCVGALLSSSNSSVKGPVCEGYSRAFQLLCQRAGITATVVTSGSGNHMWNNLRYGKYWTGVDVTWDDGSENSYNYDYFFQRVNNMSGHVMDDQNFVDWLEYPELSVVSDWKILPFYDVADAASSSSEFWGKPYIQYVYEQNYMSGLTCVNFGINTSLTRAQFAQILYSIAGKPEVTYINHFSDVPAGQWYTNAVVWADSNDIAHGVSDTRFGVNDAITREQLALMLYKYMGAPYVEEGYIDSFADADEVSDWALTAMNWAVRDGVMNGTNKNELQPTGKATRTATAVMISKVA